VKLQVFGLLWYAINKNDYYSRDLNTGHSITRNIHTLIGKIRHMTLRKPNGPVFRWSVGSLYFIPFGRKSNTV
jgi:hypothetical protein